MASISWIASRLSSKVSNGLPSEIGEVCGPHVREHPAGLGGSVGLSSGNLLERTFQFKVEGLALLGRPLILGPLGFEGSAENVFGVGVGTGARRWWMIVSKSVGSWICICSPRQECAPYVPSEYGRIRSVLAPLPARASPPGRTILRQPSLLMPL